ncbi:MAG TPA: hypothetical protein VGD40_12580 [Chryseosolibacter sp.]
MKRMIMMIAALVITGAAYSQEYKVSKSTGTLEIREVNNVTIEGSAGNEIVFSSRGRNRDDDERAKGLRTLSASGLEDNTGLGLSVVANGDRVEVQQLKKMDGPEVTIKVPKGVKVIYSHTSPHGSDIDINNFEGELEVSTVHNGVNITNSNGPLNIKTVHGDIEATLTANLKTPARLVSVHGHVDVGMPVTMKANLRLGTSWGEILVDPDFKIEIDKTGNFVKYSDKVSGKLNGGGIDIEIASTHNNVYLRKK